MHFMAPVTTTSSSRSWLDSTLLYCMLMVQYITILTMSPSTNQMQEISALDFQFQLINRNWTLPQCLVTFMPIFAYISPIFQILCHHLPIRCKIFFQNFQIRSPSTNQMQETLFQILVMAIFSIPFAYPTYFHAIKGLHLKWIDTPKCIKDQLLKG